MMTERVRRRPLVSSVALVSWLSERIGELVRVAGGDDQVWPSLDHAHRIAERRSDHGVATTVIDLPEAGHYCSLPGEPPPTGGLRMARGGTVRAAAALGRLAWPRLLELLR